ncbi:MAG TPA: PIG-L family deacetylase [Terriglobia bacterium]|nr:PIG-L family deacetylase [Terriglobia bacterium]
MLSCLSARILNCSTLMASVIALSVFAQGRQSPQRTVLAVGAHAGDMEVSCGAVLAKQRKLGDRVVILHLTLGERGNPKLSPEEYARQKEAEAKTAAAAIGAELIFGPYKDAELPNDEQVRRYVADVIRTVKPSILITHWKHSMHKDHAAASAITVDAELLASLAGVKTDHPAYNGVKAIYFAENWEDKEGFTPYVYVDVSEAIESWEKCAKAYEFVRGGVASFRYFDYYRALARVRGAEAGMSDAVALDIDSMGKKQILQSLP